MAPHGRYIFYYRPPAADQPACPTPTRSKVRAMNQDSPSLSTQEQWGGTHGEAAPSLLSLRGIVKSFVGVRVLDQVDFDLRAGEVHVLFGENGAGKSTLINIAAGALSCDEGILALQGETMRFHSVQDARRAGIVEEPEFWQSEEEPCFPNPYYGFPSISGTASTARRPRRNRSWGPVHSLATYFSSVVSARTIGLSEGALLGCVRPIPVRQAAGEGPVRLAADRRWRLDPDARTARAADRGYGLETDCSTAADTAPWIETPLCRRRL